MNSKKKNKNRQNKPPNLNPPQKQEDSEPPIPPQVINEEVVESVVEDRVPNIISENVTTELKEREETPKKPNRNRGKKKKEDEKTDKGDEVKLEEPIVDPGVQPDKDFPEETNITPATRKKKNKKGQVPKTTEKQEESEIVLLDEGNVDTQEVSLSKEEEPEQETKSAKKKNKKKKHRNDSERSEKEEVSCTSAFQKLLAEDEQFKSVSKPATDSSSSISEATVKEVEIVPHISTSSQTKPQETLQTLENNKNKKKNKKDKKQPSDDPKVVEQIQATEITEPQKTVLPSDSTDVTSETIVKRAVRVDKVDESLPSSSSVDEKNIKEKAKIAKPVEKKKKGKGNEKPSAYNPEDKTTSDVKPEIVEGTTSTEKAIVQEASPIDRTALTEDLDDVILVPLTEMTPDWQEEVKIEEKNGPVIGCEDKTETIVIEPPTGKHKKNKNKSPKSPRKTEMTASSSEATLLQASCSSTDQTGLEQAVPFKRETEEKVKISEDNLEQAPVTGNIDILNERERSSKLEEMVPTPAETMCESPKFCEITQTQNKLEEQPAHTLETKRDETVKSPEASNEHLHIRGKRNNRKKSPKPPRKNEMEIVQPEPDIPHIDEVTLPVVPSCPGLLTLKSQELPKSTSTVLLEQTESGEDEKPQKRKKSPKPVVDIEIASGSKDTKQPQKNVGIEDIIIIPADVVSDEKAQKFDQFMVCSDVTDKRDTVINKHDGDKPKKRKKSPKPPQNDIRQSTDNARMETQIEVQMPVTPIIEDRILSPEVSAVESGTPQMYPIPSPNEVTPDLIEYPRCSSEHLDSNNNMLIQEISHSDIPLNVPLVTPDTPFDQSKNINSPELATSGTKVTHIDFQKTDLKSKVMEVNQDMEELRLSIERSLAELTSLEKSDRDAEKQMKEENKENPKSNLNVEVIATVPVEENLTFSDQIKDTSPIQPVSEVASCQEPICPVRKDHKGKGKSKKKGKQESVSQNQPAQSSTAASDSTTAIQSEDTKKEDTNKSEQKSGEAQEKTKKETSGSTENKDDDLDINEDNAKKNQSDFEPIENFEDAMTSSVDDVNKSFEMIANEVNPRLIVTQNNPEINVIAPQEDVKEGKQEKQNPVTPPKNLLGHPDIPVPSSRTDYKKEKNKPPNYRQAKVKIRDANQVQIETLEKSKQSKESQTESKRKHLNYKKPDESICVTNQNDDYVYKYSFRKVFLQCACHVCKKDLKQARVPCSYCNLTFYCSQKHKDEDYSQHQALCFAVSTIVHLKDQKFIYADARDVTGHNYRLLRMQMIVSCEKILKRRLAPWEQETLLYPRICGHPGCREWRQEKLVDCEGCGQISYCSEHPDHLPKTHSRWCKSYNLYRALVKHQQTLGRLEPKLPTRVAALTPLPDNINEVLASMYEEKIDMSDIEYAALTQLATAPLTALFCLQHKANNTNGVTKKSTLTLHIVGAELQFEADVLNKWEVFLLHLVPDVMELRVVLVGPDLNPSNLPLELLGKIKLCENCQNNKRRVVFGFQDKRTYHEFWASEDFTAPDLVCAFNPSIQRSSTYTGKDTWPSTINCILKLRTPFAITSYTLSELTSDLLRVQECATVGYNVVCAPRNNSFASVRPDRNFISDDEAPLLFKNHCVTVVCGV